MVTWRWTLQVVALVGQPRPQLGPLADERLVRHLHRALVDRHQPRRGQRGDDAVDAVAAVAGRSQLGEGRPPAGVVGAVAGLDQAQQRLLGDVAVDVVESGQHLIGGRADRTRHPAGGAVGVEGERAAVAFLPRRAQRVGQQRQRPRLALHLAHQQLDQPGLDPEAGPRGGLDDGARAARRAPWGRAAPDGRRARRPARGRRRTARRSRPAAPSATGRWSAEERRRRTRRGRRASSTWVNSSSNWSTTSRRSVSRSTSSKVRVVPGVMTSAPAAHRGPTPARSTLDLPLPDAPMTATNGWRWSRASEVGDDRCRDRSSGRRRRAERDEAGVGALGAGRRRVDAERRRAANTCSRSLRPRSLRGPEVDELGVGRQVVARPAPRCPSTGRPGRRRRARAAERPCSW